MIRAGQLNHRIVIEAPDQVDNARGGRKARAMTDGWTVLASPWAEIVALRGDEAVRSSVERAVQLWRVTIRYRTDVTTAHRIVWRGIVMDIKSAAPNAEGDGLVMTCESGANG